MNSLHPFVPFAKALQRRAGETVRGAIIDSVPHFIVDDHRWMLPAIWVSNKATSLDRPPLVLLDFHSELSPWDEESVEHQILSNARSVDDIVNCCEAEGRRGSETTVHDGNWLTAAVKLAWVGPVVTIGLESAGYTVDPPGILECGRIDSRLFRRNAHWFEPRNRDFHEAIGWQLSIEEVTLSEPPRNIQLTVDLDVFAKGGDDGNGMRRRSEKDLIRSLATPYSSGLARGRTFLETYRAWLRKASFVLIAMETQMFIGYLGKASQRKRAEGLLESFWAIVYGAVPELIELGT
jgi:hypothetical protein